METKQELEQNMKNALYYLGKISDLVNTQFQLDQKHAVAKGEEVNTTSLAIRNNCCGALLSNVHIIAMYIKGCDALVKAIEEQDEKLFKPELEQATEAGIGNIVPSEDIGIN
jgi:hypothetical protein